MQVGRPGLDRRPRLRRLGRGGEPEPGREVAAEDDLRPVRVGQLPGGRRAGMPDELDPDGAQGHGDNVGLGQRLADEVLGHEAGPLAGQQDSQVGGDQPLEAVRVGEEPAQHGPGIGGRHGDVRPAVLVGRQDAPGQDGERGPGLRVVEPVDVVAGHLDGQVPRDQRPPAARRNRIGRRVRRGGWSRGWRGGCRGRAGGRGGLGGLAGRAVANTAAARAANIPVRTMGRLRVRDGRPPAAPAELTGGTSHPARQQAGPAGLPESATRCLRRIRRRGDGSAARKTAA